MSVMDNEGRDPNGLFNKPRPLDIDDLVRRTIARQHAEIEHLTGVAAKAIADNVTLRAIITAAMQRLNESGTGEMGLIDTIHATHAMLGAANVVR